jgi:hypothetical protein
VILFVAPTLSGAGPVAFGPLPEARPLRHVVTERVGEDVMLTGYLRDP